MAIIYDELSVWDISFRWAGYDPDGFWLRYPLLVKDNFRLLIEVILGGEIICSTLCLDKLPPDSNANPDFYIRTHIDDIYACIHGRKYNRKLLKWATLGRMDFLEWCNQRGIPPPDFWFPPGWKLEYESPYDGIPPGLLVQHEEPRNGALTSFSYHFPVPETIEQSSCVSESVEEKDDPMPAPSRPNQLARIACQQIAKAIWAEDPTRTIASVVKDDLIKKYGGGAYFEYETVREWIKVIAPLEVRQKRGRPRNKNGAEEE